MSSSFSFDVTSDYDVAEINNVFDQTQREITNRYDFKGTPAQLEWLDPDKTGIKITGSGEWQIDAITDIFRKKLATRKQSQKVLDTSSELVVNNLQTSKNIPFKKGISHDQAKKINNLIRDNLKKVKTQIQGDEIRVTSNSKNDLQTVMQLLVKQDFDFPLDFTNFR